MIQKSGKVQMRRAVNKHWPEYGITQVLQLMTGLVYPPRCPICDDIITPRGAVICTKCKEIPKVIREPYCMKCGKPVLTEGVEYCYDCSRRNHYFKQGRAVFEYHSVSDSIFRYKYQGRREYSGYYGDVIYEELSEQIRKWKPDGIVPVPLHKSKIRKRGFNQAELIAGEIGKKMEISVYPKLVKRVRKTIPQKLLNDGERQNNLKKAFKISENDVKLKTIIIIDDIYTTGSTIDAVAKELLAIGVVDIYFITLAIGKGF